MKNPICSASSAVSPRPWGCFSVTFRMCISFQSFPTPVGVFPDQRNQSSWSTQFPHARGGVSIPNRYAGAQSGVSPRPWGCFSSVKPHAVESDSFPTPVGVFLIDRAIEMPFSKFPHARGGVSDCMLDIEGLDEVSPRPWGCFPQHVSARHAKASFPTPVGVFPKALSQQWRHNEFPHARGGVSDGAEFEIRFCEVSPRPWGCFC